MNRKRGLGIVSFLLAGVLLASPAWGAAGDLLWEQTFNYPGYPNVEVGTMVASPTRFIMTFTIRPTNDPTGTIGYIQAFDAVTGDAKWGHTISEGATSNDISIHKLDGDLLITKVVSSTALPGYVNNKVTTRCYVADTGFQSWEVPMALVTSTKPASESLVVANNRVFNVVTSVSTLGNPTGNIMVQAYQERNLPVQTILLLE